MSIANAGESVPLPTAVGFCMWVSRAAWQEVGGFDERFGRGYGEEVEFCMATAANGWRHLLACDVFVYHAGGTSFGYESEQLKAKAQQIIDDRYPNFLTLCKTGSEKTPRWTPAFAAMCSCLAWLTRRGYCMSPTTWVAVWSSTSEI